MDQGFYFYFSLLPVVWIVTDTVNRSFNCTLNSQDHSARVSGAGRRPGPACSSPVFFTAGPVGTAEVFLQVIQFHFIINSYIFLMGFPFEHRFPVPEENVSFSFSSWCPTDRSGSFPNVERGPGCWVARVRV